jgi:uncharacterized protein (TIGR00251 family)
VDGAGRNLNLRKVATGVVVPVRLTPKSGRDEIVGLEDFGGETVLKVRVRAVPENGRANAALEKLIAKWLGVPPSAVKVAHGGKSRLKQIAIDGDPLFLPALVAERLAEI